MRIRAFSSEKTDHIADVSPVLDALVMIS